MPIKIHNVEQGTKEWHELRKLYPHTGSVAHNLLKHGTKDYPRNDSKFTGNFYTRRGHALEPEAIEVYEAIKDVKVDRFGFITNSKFPGCGYSPDGSTDRIIEVKAFNEKRHKEVPNNVPLEIQAQVQFGMMIMEMKLADLILYNPEIDAEDCLFIITIKRNNKIIDNFKRILYGEK